MKSNSHNNNDDGHDEMNVHTILKFDSLWLINWLAFIISCEQDEKKLN